MTAETIIIRKAEKKDLPAMIELLQQLFSLEEDFTPNPALQKKGLTLLLEKPESGYIFVAETDGRVIGMCSLQRLVSTAEGSEVGLLEDMIIDASCRKKNIGKQLLAYVVQWATDQGFVRLQLLADKNNTPALNFYDKMGWRTTQLICLRKK